MIGAGSYSPYADIIDIAHRLQSDDIDAVMSIGQARILCMQDRSHAQRNSKPGLSETDMEALVDQKQGLAGDAKLRAPTTKLICVPTSLSAGEWNSYASGTNSHGEK